MTRGTAQTVKERIYVKEFLRAVIYEKADGSEVYIGDPKALEFRKTTNDAPRRENGNSPANAGEPEA